MEEPKWRESISIELEEENCDFEARLYLVDVQNSWSNLIFSIPLTQSEIVAGVGTMPVCKDAP